MQQQSIEATLGQDAVRSGLLAGAVGLGAVLLFMVFYYLLPGAVACFALLLYTLFTYAIFVLVPVTFTLPGIAGFVLSVGMAVDANVLIFERARRSLRARARRSGRRSSRASSAPFRPSWTPTFVPPSPRSCCSTSGPAPCAASR